MKQHFTFSKFVKVVSVIILLLLLLGVNFLPISNRYWFIGGVVVLLFLQVFSGFPDFFSDGFSAKDSLDRLLRYSSKQVLTLPGYISNYGVIILDANGTIVNCFDDAVHQHGYTNNHLAGKSFEVFFTEQAIAAGDPAHFLDMATQMGTYETEMWCRRPNGTKFLANVVLSALVDSAGKLQGFVKVVKDNIVAEPVRKQMELLSFQINQTRDAIYTTDANNLILSWNRGAENLYGFRQEEVLGREPNSFLHTNISEADRLLFLRQLTDTGYWHGEIIGTTRSGEKVHISSSASTICNSEGMITGYTVINIDITAQKKLNEQLKHLADIVEQSSEAIFSRSLDRRILTWNAGAEKMFGYSKAEAIGKTHSELRLVLLPLAEKEEIQQTVIDLGCWKGELQFYHKNGSIFFGAVTANALRDSAGETTSFYFIIKDVTLSKSLEEKLRLTNESLEVKILERTATLQKSEEKYRYLFNNNPLPMWVLDPVDFAFLDVNEMAIEHYGYSRAEFLSMKATDIRPDTEKARFIELNRNNLDEGIVEVGIWSHCKKDGTIIKVRILSHRLLFDGKPAKLILVNDVTEKVIAEQKLLASEKRFRTLLEYNFDVISLMDARFNVTYRSPSAARVTGWALDEIRDESVLHNVHPDDVPYAKDIIQQIMERPGESIKTLFRIRHKNGNYLWVEGTVINLLSDECVQSIVFNYRDVTERIEAEKKLSYNELRFRLLIENSVEGISLLDAAGNALYRSPSGYRMMGDHPMEQAVDNAHTDFLSSFKSKFRESLAAPGKPVAYKVYFRHSDGHYFWAEGTFTNLLDIEGVNAVVANYRDVTEKVEAEKKLVFSEKRFRAMIENNKDVIMLLDAEDNITYRSPSATAVNGWTDQETLLQPVAKYIHPGDILYIKEIVANVKSNPGKPLSFLVRNQHKNGSYRWLEGIVTNLLHDESVSSILLNFRDVTERIEADEKLLASELRFRTSLDNMLEGVQIIGFDWRYLYVNEALCLQGRSTKDVLLGYTMMEKYPGIEHSELFKCCQRCFTERVSIHLENEFHFPDGSMGWFELSIQPVQEGIFILSVDVTERKLAEEKIVASETRFRSLIENISDGIVMNDGAFNIRYQSPSVERILGYTADERSDKKVLDFIHPDSREDFIRLNDLVKANPGIPFDFEYQFFHKNGYYIWLEGVITNLLDNPAVNAYVANYRDVTGRKASEEAVKQSERVYRTIASSIPGSIISMIDKDLRLVLIEGELVKKMGFSKEHLLGKIVNDVMPPEYLDESLLMFEKAFNGEYATIERAIGGYDLISRYVPIRDENDEVQNIMIVTIDVSDLKAAQRNVIELNHGLEEKVLLRTAELKKVNEELESFSYSVSHDLRAPLRAIIGFASILDEEYCNALDAEAKRIIGVIKSNTLKMGMLIDDLLTFSRLRRQDIVKTFVSTDEIVYDISSMFHKSDSAVKPPSWIIHPLPDVYADGGALKQVWINLLSNAVKYSAKNTNPEIEVGSYESDCQTVFYVRDNGAGFDDRYKDKLFKVFQRLHSEQEFEGTGIGLAIVEKIVSKHGGSVWAEGKAGKGACFYFSLPNETAKVLTNHKN